MRIAIYREWCLLIEVLGVVLAANSINHAHGMWIEVSTGAVNHAGLDDIIELRLIIWIWDLGSDHAVNVMRVLQLAVSLQDDEQMRMRKATFLKLDHMNRGHRFPQDMLLVDVFKKFVELFFEHPSYQIWSVFSTLSAWQILTDIWAFRVTCECQEQVRFAILGYNSHCILIVLLLALGLPWNDDGSITI